MADQEQNSNNNITNHNTYHVHSQNVQIGEDNKLHYSNEQTDKVGNIEYDVEQLKVTVAAQGQKLENQAEQLKVYDRVFKQLPANQQIHSQRLANNCSITLDVFHDMGGKVGEIQVTKDITVRELNVKLQQKFHGGRGDIWIFSRTGGVVYEDGVTGDSRTVRSLGLGDCDEVHYL